jgi:hypothetical protein
MAFKLKDLMIHVLPSAQAGQAANAAPPAQCPNPSGQPFAAAVVCPIPSHPVCPVPSGPGIMAQGLCPMISATQPGVYAQVACPMFSAAPQSFTCADAAQTPDPTYLTNLATLKQQLQQALDQVAQQEAVAHAAAKPQTVAEAEALEKQLQDALAELQAHKQNLTQKA